MSEKTGVDQELFRARIRRGAGAGLVVFLAAAAIAIFVTAITPRGGEHAVAGAENTSAAQGSDFFVSDSAASSLFVHVLGQVTNPGLYELQTGDRVVDAIAAAGGLGEEADPAGVNLARLLIDGEQLNVPKLGENAAAGQLAGLSQDGRVDLNQADAEALATLPRIGPATAERIIQHREANGPYRSVDDLAAVSGIGVKTVESLRGLVSP